MNPLTFILVCKMPDKINETITNTIPVAIRCNGLDWISKTKFMEYSWNKFLH